LRCAPSAIVVDASVVLELLLRTPEARAVERRLFGANETLHAPHLIDVEVAHVLCSFALAGEMSMERGREALEDLTDLSLRRYPHEVLLPRVWELRANLTAYDAIYVALAEALDAPLFTRDRRLAGAVGHRARIEVA
jgi:predicted nucleic acid-binding protein